MLAGQNVVDKFLNQRIWIHIFFWLMISLIFYVFFAVYIFESFSVYLANLVAILPSQILLSYFFIYFLIPKFLLKKRYFLFVLYFLVALYLSLVLARFLTVYVVEEINNRGFYKNSIYEILTDVSHLIKRYLLTVTIAPIIMLPVKVIKDRLVEKKNIEELEKEKVNAQLNLLKAQINPHFLFNTLNNLYLLTLEKRDEAPEVVLKLSEMMDYMLYQCNVPKVPLHKEIDLLKNYIDLEKLRYTDQLEVHLDSQISDLSIKIAPLILLTLVENAFKHGASPSANSSHIRIDIKEEKGRLNFTVFNSKPAHPLKVVSKGMGLDNMKGQLKLLYPNKHDITVIEDSHSYEINLKIEL